MWQTLQAEEGGPECRGRPLPLNRHEPDGTAGAQGEFQAPSVPTTHQPAPIKPYLWSFLYSAMRLMPSSAAARRRLFLCFSSASRMRSTSASFLLAARVVGGPKRGVNGTLARKTGSV